MLAGEPERNRITSTQRYFDFNRDRLPESPDAQYAFITSRYPIGDGERSRLCFRALLALAIYYQLCRAISERRAISDDNPHPIATDNARR